MKNTWPLMPLFILLSSFFWEDNTTQVAQLLCNGTWHQDAYYADLDGDGVITESSLPCMIGDGWKFNIDNTFEFRDEIANCNSDLDSVSVLTGRWELRNNDTEVYIEVDSDFLFYQFTIYTINANLLVLKQFNDSSSQAPLEERLILSR